MIGMSDAIHTISADGNATLQDFSNYNGTILGLHGLSPVASVGYGSGVIAIALKDGRTCNITIQPDNTFHIESSGFFSDSEFETMRGVSQVIGAFATGNSLSTLTDSFV